MKILYINQIGTYTFKLPKGQLAIVITYKGFYPHYSSLSEITANQLISKEENVYTSVDNQNRTVSIYNKNISEYTQAIVILSNQ